MRMRRAICFWKICVGGLCSLLLILIAWGIRLFLLLQNTGILGNQIAEHVCKAAPFVNRSDVCDKDHLRASSFL